MLTKLLFSLFLFCSPFHNNNDNGGEATLKKMYDRYQNKWYHSFTFNQTTEIYRNDSLKRKETWYEAVEFPDKFRIDFGPSDSGNAVIFKGDSAYRFKKGIYRSAVKDGNDLTFLLGGMYFYSFDRVKEKLKNQGYDLNKFHTDIWKGIPVYVIGAAKGENNVNQLWIDQKRLLLIRLITFNHNVKEEAIFENHIPLQGGWSETKCTFYFNDKLGQVETYHDCRSNVKLDPRIFEPSEFGKVYWFK